MVKKCNKSSSIEERIKFYDDVSAGNLNLAETSKRMRAIVGMTQPQYAQFVGIAPRIIIDLERGTGNPTLNSLNKVGKPFGLELGFITTK